MATRLAARTSAPLVAGLAALAMLTAGAATATAEPLELGGFLGPRVFASDSALGDVDGVDTSLGNSVVVGVRAARALFPWLVAEAELPLSAPTTREHEVDVLWMEPRVQARFELRPRRRLRPFLAAGVGLPIALSSKRGIFGSDLSVEGYGGGGVHVLPGRGVNLRLDVRVGVQPGTDAAVVPEVEIIAGLWLPIGGSDGDGRRRGVVAPPDRDDDGIIDADDACADRGEDADGFEDRDGCPDIDNDGDRVLDIADGCASVPESYNGIEDDDGCPDTVPREVDVVLGTVEGLLYGPGSTEVRASADRGLARIAALLAKHPSLRLIIVGHADDREALVTAQPAAGGQPAADEPPAGEAAAEPAELAMELSRVRAAAVKNALVGRGVAAARLDVVGRGAEEPVSDNDSPRGRLRNRRVEIKLYVPVR